MKMRDLFCRQIFTAALSASALIAGVSFADLNLSNASNVAVGKNIDGRLEMFAAGTDQQMYHRYQVTPGGGWTAWGVLPGKFWKNVTSFVSTVNNAEGNLDVYFTASNSDNPWDGQVVRYVQKINSAGYYWAVENLGGNAPVLDVKGVRNPDGRMEVFMRSSNTDFHVDHKWQNTPGGTWSSWGSLLGMTIGAVVYPIRTAFDKLGQLNVFICDQGRMVSYNQRSTSNAWQGWKSIGGNVGGNYEYRVESNKDGRLEVFAIGPDNNLWHIWQQADYSWNGSTWNYMWGLFYGLSSIIDDNGRIHLFMRNSSNQIVHAYQTSDVTWSNLENLGGNFTGPPALNIATAKNPDGRLEVFIKGNNNYLQHDFQVTPNGAWSGWTSNF